jgi:hypothetical protein
VPDLAAGEASVYSPRAGIETPDAEWKSFEMMADVVPPRRDTFKG